MSAAKSTPAPASVEQAAHQASARHEGCCSLCFKDGYARGHADATEEVSAALERANRALDNHLCEYDKADWLACAGHGERHCEVCAEADRGEHRHALQVKLERANGLLREARFALGYHAGGEAMDLIGRLDDHLSGEQPARIQATKATAAEIHQAAGVTEDELRVGRAAVEAVRRPKVNAPVEAAARAAAEKVIGTLAGGKDGALIDVDLAVRLGYLQGHADAALTDRTVIADMTRVLVLYHPAASSYAMPEPDSEAGIHEAVERFARHVRERHPEATELLTIHRFYAPSWEAWCQAMGPLEISAQSIPLLKAMNPDGAKSATPRTGEETT